MEVKIIRNQAEFDKALIRFDALMTASINNTITKEEDEVYDLLSLVIEHYENTNFEPITPPEPIVYIKLRMEERGLKQKDLIGVIGSKTTVSEVLNKKSRLTLNMIRILSDMLHIPAGSLIQKYELEGNGKEVEQA